MDKRTGVMQNNVLVVRRLTGGDLRELRDELGQSLAEFGWTLKRAIDPQAKYPFTRQYISRLEKSKNIITPEIATAFWNIAAAHDERPAGIGGAGPVTILANPNQVHDNVYLSPTARERPCKRPGCPVLFVSDNPLMQYHHPDCQKAHAEDVLRDRIAKILKVQPESTSRDIARILHVALDRIEAARQKSG